MVTASTSVGPRASPQAAGEHDSAYSALPPLPVTTVPLDHDSGSEGEKGVATGTTQAMLVANPYRHASDDDSRSELITFAAYMRAREQGSLGWITSFDQWVHAPWLRWYPTWEDYQWELFRAWDRAVTAGCRLGFDEWTHASGLALE